MDLSIKINLERKDLTNREIKPDGVTVGDLRKLIHGVEDHRLLLVEMTPDENDYPEGRAAIREIGMCIKNLRQFDGKDKDLFILDLMISDY